MSTYIDLKNDIQSWLADADMASVIPVFIRLCEVQINRELTTLAQETTVELSVEPTQTPSATNYVPLPDDFIEIVTISSPQTQDNSALQYVSPDRMVAEDSPYFYSIKGSLIMLPTSVFDIVLTYAAKFPELTDTETTNWLTANAYDALLYGSLTHAEGYVMNDQRISLWESAYRRAMDSINEEDDNARYSGNELRVI